MRKKHIMIKHRNRAKNQGKKKMKKNKINSEREKKFSKNLSR